MHAMGGAVCLAGGLGEGGALVLVGGAGSPFSNLVNLPSKASTFALMIPIAARILLVSDIGGVGGAAGGEGVGAVGACMEEVTPDEGGACVPFPQQDQ